MQEFRIVDCELRIVNGVSRRVVDLNPKVFGPGEGHGAAELQAQVRCVGVSEYRSVGVKILATADSPSFVEPDALQPERPLKACDHEEDNTQKISKITKIGK
jgi:hypothetical protein